MRDYKRTSKRASWSEEDVEIAVKSVLDGTISNYEAAILYDIPVSTLRRKVLKAKECEDVKIACKKSMLVIITSKIFLKFYFHK